MLLINLLRRTHLATAALIAFSALVPKLTLAQPVPLPVPASGLQGFPQDDVERMHAAAARLYEGSSTVQSSNGGILAQETPEKFS